MKILPINEIDFDDEAVRYSISSSKNVDQNRNYLAEGLFLDTLNKYMTSIYQASDKDQATKFTDELEAYINTYADTPEKQALATSTGANLAINNQRKSINAIKIPVSTADTTDTTPSTNKTNVAAIDTLPDNVEGWTIDKLIGELKRYGYKQENYNLTDLENFAKAHPEIVKILNQVGDTGSVFQNSTVEFTLPTGQKIVVQMGGDVGFDSRDDRIISVSEGTTFTTAKDAFEEAAKVITDQDKEPLTAKTLKPKIVNQDDTVELYAKPLMKRQDPDEFFNLMENQSLFGAKLASSLVDYIRDSLSFQLEKNKKEPVEI